MLAVLFRVGHAAAQDEVPEPISTVPYYSHLSSPSVPSVRVTNVRIGDASPALAGTTSLRQGVEANLRMRIALMKTQAATTGVRVRVSTPSGSAEETFWIPTGEWRVGEAREWSAPLRVPPFTASGAGTLTLTQLFKRHLGPARIGDGVRIPVDEAILYREPIIVQPDPVNSRVDPETLKKAFGDRFVRLDTAVRLTHGASVELNTDHASAGPVVGVGLVLAIGGSFDVKAGAVCVDVRDQSGNDALAFKAGRDVSFVNASVAPPGVVKLRARGESVAAPFADWHDDPAAGTVYFVQQRFQSARPATPLTVTGRLESGFVDIFDVVLLTDRPPAP